MRGKCEVSDLVFIAVISAGILAYELLLTRVLSVQYWSYFASMIVSLAMLGFAASGTALFLLSRRKRGTTRLVPWAALLFAVAVPICPRISERIDCVPLVVLWEPRQALLFAANYLILSLPLFLGGFIVGHFFVVGDLRAGRVYFANMLGSGLGVLTALSLLCRMRPLYALCFVALAVLVVTWTRMKRLQERVVLVISLIGLFMLAASAPVHPALSQYKGMSRLLLMPDAEVEHAQWNRFGYTTVVDSETIRYAPGLSLMFAGRIPAQKAIFTDGDNMDVVCRPDSEEAASLYFDSMLSAAAYRFHQHPRVLVIGAGGGMQVLDAVLHGASTVEALENNSAVADLMQGPLADFSGHLFDRSNVTVKVTSTRAYANAVTNRYDLVVVPGKRSAFASAAGTSAQDPDYLLTVEALADFFELLDSKGVLAIETWLNLPPRHSAKIFATAIETLDREGLIPGRHLVALRSLRTALVLVFKQEIMSKEIELVQEFCAERSFDVIYHPGISPDDANRFNRVEGAPYYRICADLLRNPRGVAERHVFQVEPPVDDAPYFSHFFKWRALPQFVRKTGRNAVVQIGWGYMFLLITLVQAIPLGFLLILLPLTILRRRGTITSTHRSRTYLHFSALGFGFMFLELAAIQQFVRFLRHPVYAFGVTIGIVLLFSGVGAFVSAHRKLTQARVYTAILGLILAHLVLWRASVHLRSSLLFSADVMVIAVLSFFMGMPFPRAIERLQVTASGIVPWAWGINGFVSVLAVLGAGLISVSFGLSALVVLSGTAYAVAGLTFPRTNVEAGS